jgi:hypothetical protein
MDPFAGQELGRQATREMAQEVAQRSKPKIADGSDDKVGGLFAADGPRGMPQQTEPAPPTLDREPEGTQEDEPPRGLGIAGQADKDDD